MAEGIQTLESIQMHLVEKASSKFGQGPHLNSSTYKRMYRKPPNNLTNSLTTGCALQAHAKTTTKFMDGLKRLIPIMFSASHILGCIWWYIGTHNVDENSDLKKHWIGYYQAFGTTNVLADANVLEQYILCFFWATASLSTNGQIGDSQPKSFTEMIFGCVIMLHSLTVYVYLLSELSDLVMNQDQELVVTRRQVMYF